MTLKYQFNRQKLSNTNAPFARARKTLKPKQKIWFGFADLVPKKTQNYVFITLMFRIVSHIIHKICRIDKTVITTAPTVALCATTEPSQQCYPSSSQAAFHSDLKHDAKPGSKRNGYDGSTQRNAKYTV